MAWIISCLLYRSETWAMRAELESKLERTKMRMIRWMRGVCLKERQPGTELWRHLGVEANGDVMRRCRHIERKHDADCAKACAKLVAQGTSPIGRPKNTASANILPPTHPSERWPWACPPLPLVVPPRVPASLPCSPGSGSAPRRCRSPLHHGNRHGWRRLRGRLSRWRQVRSPYP